MNRIFKGIVKTLIVLGLIMAYYNAMNWKDSVKNPKNDAYVTEVAFNLGIEKHQVKQWMFNERYLNN